MWEHWGIEVSKHREGVETLNLEGVVVWEHRGVKTERRCQTIGFRGLRGIGT